MYFCRMCDLLSHISKGLPFVIESNNNKKVFTERINYTSSKNELYDVYFIVEFDAI